MPRTKDDTADKTAGSSWTKDDVIVTAGFTVVGHITTPGFALTSNYGTLNVKLEDVREARRDIATDPEEIRKSISVPGQTFAQRTYTNTSIKLAKGDVVTLTGHRQLSSCSRGAAISNADPTAPPTTAT